MADEIKVSVNDESLSVTAQDETNEVSTSEESLDVNAQDESVSVYTQDETVDVESGSAVLYQGAGESGIVSWGSITGKPETYPPEPHSHYYSEIKNPPVIPVVPDTLPNPHALTINGKTYDGSSPVNVEIEGGIGNSEPGEDGGYYVPSVSNGVLTWTATKDDMPSVEPSEVRGEPGLPGLPGAPGTDGVGIQNIVQTTAPVTSGGMNTITVYLTDGTTEKFYVRNGQQGEDGEDGISPTISVGAFDEAKNCYYLRITDANGSETVTIKNGADGEDGVGISNIEITTSSVDGGENLVTINKTDGTSSTFTVRNGSKGSTGVGIQNIHFEGTTESGQPNHMHIVMTDGTINTFDIYNGTAGAPGTGGGGGLGACAFEIDTNGNLIMLYPDDSTPPNLAINTDGELILTLED